MEIRTIRVRRRLGGSQQGRVNRFASAEPSTSLAGRSERPKHAFGIAKGFVDTRLFLLEPGGGNYSSLRTTKSKWRSMVVSPTGELIETAGAPT